MSKPVKIKIFIKKDNSIIMMLRFYLYVVQYNVSL